MSTGKNKGGEAAASYDYHGTLAGLLGSGPADTLHRIVVDEKVIWEGPVSRTASGEPDYHTVVTSRGRIRFYWGTDTQAVCPLLTDGGSAHPAYRGMVYIVLDDFLFGRERTVAPSIQVVWSRRPANQMLVSGSGIGLDTEGQANAAAFLAEVISDPRQGLGIDHGKVDTESFQLLADALDAVDGRARYGISPWIDRAIRLRSLIGDFGNLTDGWLRAGAGDGRLRAGRFGTAEGIDPTTLPLLRYRHLTEPPALRQEGWQEVANAVQVAFEDRERGFKQSSETFGDLRARAVSGDERVESVSRPWIRRRTQARLHAAELSLRLTRPGLEGRIRTLRHLSDETGTVTPSGIDPGDRIRLDIELEPGTSAEAGGTLDTVFRVLSREMPPEGPITFDLEAESALAPLPGESPADLPEEPGDAAPAALLRSRVFELPPRLAGGDRMRLGVLAARGDSLTTGLRVHFDFEEIPTDPQREAYAAIGSQGGFAVAGSFQSGVDPDDTVVDFSIQNAPGQPLTFEDILDEPPGGLGARNATLLLVGLVASVEGGIALDAEGLPWLEIMAVEDWTVLPIGFYRFAVRRGQFGTRIREFADFDECWVVPRSHLRAYYHPDFPRLAAAGEAIYLKLRPANAWAVRDLAQSDPIGYRFSERRSFEPEIVLTSPGSEPVSLALGGTVTIAGSVNDPDGDLDSLSILSRAAESDTFRVHLTRILERGRGAAFAQPVVFGEAGRHLVRIEARDSGGRLAVREVAVDVDAAAGQAEPPQITPPGGLFEDYRLVEIEVASGLEIHFAVSAMHGTQPSLAAFSRIDSESYSLILEEPSRLWAFARDPSVALSDSALVFQDFEIIPAWPDSGQSWWRTR